MNKRQESPLNVAVGLSGGVDSAVAAALLKEQGHTVKAVYLDCWQKGTGCATDEDRKDAVQVAAKLDLPFQVFDFKDEYRELVLNYFYREYREGRTPNPDIICNQEIKFGLFREKALPELGVEAIATGHYVRRQQRDDSYHLLRGIDEGKDQSYFLYRLGQTELSQSLFPIGHLTKEEVRTTARRLDLPNWDKPDSQGLCFVGKIDLVDFLRRELPEKEGPVLNTDGQRIGTHRGAWFYTIGQRHGFDIQKYQGVPQYVLEKRDNCLVVGPRRAAFQDAFRLEDLAWILGQPYSGSGLIRIRHLGKLLPGQIHLEDNGARVQLKEPVFAVAPGQSAAIYREEELLGGGIITAA